MIQRKRHRQIGKMRDMQQVKEEWEKTETKREMTRNRKTDRVNHIDRLTEIQGELQIEIARDTVR